MAGKKKKKPAANPARGFATVSVASKPKISDSVGGTPDGSNTPTDLHEQISGPDVLTENVDTSTEDQGKTKDIQDMTPEELEQHLEFTELKNIAETNAVKVKSSAARQVTKLINERRQLRQQADRATVPGLTDIVVERVLEHGIQEIDVPRSNQTVKQAPKYHVNEDELLLDLWTLREVLQSLKMPDIENALTHYAGIRCRSSVSNQTEYIPGLEACFQWYAQFKSAAELPDYITGGVNDTQPSVGYEHTGIELGQSNPGDMSAHYTKLIGLPNQVYRSICATYTDTGLVIL